ncbi:MAG: hypothetical protein N3D81_01615, partial [Spirochaetes bacterium]|nr:hypothetical protein [Spirochaetota bacterium]
MKVYVLLVLLTILIGGCYLFFYPGEYEDLLSSRDNRRSAGGSTGGLTLESGVYVSTYGNDTNNGLTKTSPVKSIQKAISIAVSNNLTYIYLSTGVYTQGNGLNTETSGVVITNDGIKIIGGFDESFSSIVGYSELDGGGSLIHIILAMNVSNVVIRNLVVRGGNANGDGITNECGGGIYFERVTHSLVSNVVLSNNSANNGGGGIFLNSSSKNILIITAVSNRADYGGGVYLFNNSVSNLVRGIVSRNFASANGGGFTI